METTTRLREATIADVPAIFAIRVSVRENSATMENLYKHGIDEQMVAGAITASGRGWIVEEGGRAVGFSIADQLEGSVFALFVRPESKGRGYGGGLLDAGVQWLFAKGFDCVWLAVGRNTRPSLLLEALVGLRRAMQNRMAILNWNFAAGFR